MSNQTVVSEARPPLEAEHFTSYTLFTVATAFSTGIYDLVVLQFIGRMFMVTEIGVGAIILTEELPARYRGRAIALMVGSGMIGGIIASFSFPFLVATPLGWRALYVVGGVLLIPLVSYWTKIQETQRWLHEQSGRERQRQERSWPRWRGEMLLLFGPEYRGRLIAGSALWFFTCLYGLAVQGFFPYYALHERGWSPERVGVTATLGFVVAFLGYFVSGPLLDSVGRKATASAYMTLGAVVATVCYQAKDPRVISVFYSLALAMSGVWAISATITGGKSFPRICGPLLTP
jgi:putative MFS transporter